MFQNNIIIYIQYHIITEFSHRYLVLRPRNFLSNMQVVSFQYWNIIHGNTPEKVIAEFKRSTIEYLS